MGILDGRVAIVTGASSGCGRGCAIRFAEEGASLVVCARRTELLDSLIDEIKHFGGKYVAVKCDTALEEDIDNVVNTCIKEFGKVDILANIAQGGLGEMDFLHEATPKGALDSFITGPLQSMLFMQKCLPYMKEAHYGRIINCASHSALVGAPGFASYEMAKSAIMALTRIASHEWGRFGITTNCFLPFIRTDAFDATEQGRATAAEMEKQIPTGYFGKPYEDLSPVIAFLASEAAGYINCQFVGVDGGMTPLA